MTVNFIWNEFRDLMRKHKIGHEVTNAYSPKSNGLDERLDRILFDMAKAMLVNLDNP